MSNYNAAGGGLQYRGTAAVSPPNCTFSANNPTPYDRFGFSLADFWLNTNTGSLFVLVSLKGNSSSKGPLADWVELSTSISAGILTISGSDNVPVSPNNVGNLNMQGGVDSITVTGNPASNEILINVATATTVNDGVTTLASGALTIAGSDGTHAVTPLGLTAKLGTQTINAVPYGSGTSSAIQWTSAGTDNTVLIGQTGLAPSFSTTPSVDSITILNDPVNPTDGANKAYVDMIGSGFTFVDAVRLATTGTNLTSTYNNGASGVGATLTNSGTQAAFTLDGVSASVNDRILVKDQTSPAQNGIYSVTTVGSPSTNWVLTRTTDYDTTAQIKPGTIVPVEQGTVNANTTWLQTQTVTTIGTDPIEFQQFSQVLPTIIPIDRGGTNASSMANPFGVNYFDGTKIDTTPVGTAGQVLTSNGAGMAPTFQTASGGGGSVTVTPYLSPGSYVFTPGINTHTIEVFGWGGGGGGGFVFGGGGGGGAMYYKAPRNAFGSSVNVVVGAGGAGATAPNPTLGGTGGISSFGNWVTGNQGAGGGGTAQGTGGFVFTISQNYNFNYLLTVDNLPAANPGGGAPAPSGVLAPNIINGSMLPGGGGNAGARGASILNPATKAVIVAGGDAGTSGSPDGSNGADGNGTDGYLAGGAGGGGGYFINGSVTGGLGGDGGFPGGGGGCGGNNVGGDGGNGAILVIEYS